MLEYSQLPLVSALTFLRPVKQLPCHMLHDLSLFLCRKEKVKVTSVARVYTLTKKGGRLMKEKLKQFEIEIRKKITNYWMKRKEKLKFYASV